MGSKLAMGKEDARVCPLLKKQNLPLRLSPRPQAKIRSWVIRCLTIVRAPVLPDIVAQPCPLNTE